METRANSNKREWASRVPERFQQLRGFEVVVDDPALPRVLFLGDSISIGYIFAARRTLSGKANLHRVTDNASAILGAQVAESIMRAA